LATQTFNCPKLRKGVKKPRIGKLIQQSGLQRTSAVYKIIEEIPTPQKGRGNKEVNFWESNNPLFLPRK